MRKVAQAYSGKPLRMMPSAKITSDRRTTRNTTAPRPALPIRGSSARGIATPTMKTKKGKITSVGVQPCHAA